MNLILFYCLICFWAGLYVDNARALHVLPSSSRPSTEDCPNQFITVPFIEGDKRLHVNLDRFPWNQASLATGLFKIGGKSISEQKTRVYIFYDQSALWLAFRCEGIRSGELKATITERDDKVWKDDSIEVLIDPSHTHKEYYHFIINSRGVIYDALGKDNNWDAKVPVETTTNNKGWTATLRIDFSQLETIRPEPGMVWAVNFCRNSTNSDKSCWAPVINAFLEPENFSHIVFGNKNTKPVRFRRVDPFRIGTNCLVLGYFPDLNYRLEGVEGKEGSVTMKEGAIPDDGKITWFISEDQIRQVKVAILDRKEKQLAQCWFPMQSPAVSEIITQLDNKFKEINRCVSRFPKDARRKTDAVLAYVKPILHKAVRLIENKKRYTPANWKWLEKSAAIIERKLDGPWSYTQTLLHFPKAEFGVGLESPMQKVMIRDFPFKGGFDKKYNLSLAQNEHEALQVVIIPFHKDLQDVVVSVTPPKGRFKANRLKTIDTEVSLVGHVEVADDTPYEVEYNGWWPDPLLNFQNKCNVQVGEHVAFWIDVSTQSDTLAGQYDGLINVVAAGCKPISIQLSVNVWNFELPNGTHLRNAFTYHESGVSSFYGNRWNEELAYLYYDLILDHRLNIDNLYRKDSPNIEVLKYGAAHGMSAFNVGSVFRHNPNGQEKKVLDQYVSKLKQADLFDSAYVYGYDEVKEDKFPEIHEVFNRIHEQFPGLKTMTTAVDHSFGKDTGLREAVDIWVPLTSWYDLDNARQLRLEGRDMWWYICVVPVHPYANWFIEYPAIESRLLTGAMSYKYQTGGFLYYMINLWTGNHKPITSGPYTNWDPGSFVSKKKGYTANGDGSLLCPGRNGPLSTIRLENIRDGLEDYEYLYLLAELVQKIGNLPETVPIRSYLERANKLLNVSESVVYTLTEYTRDPHVLYEFRTKTAGLIIEGKSIIDSHTRKSLRP
ncbi:MAG: carbohydrate-binding family 9-like protein [Planctomycetota bacterium]|jgi:hypothetical protein